jgi:putative endonuclease
VGGCAGDSGGRALTVPPRPHWSEELASQALQRRGYRLLDRNARYRVGELDLVMEEAGVLVFVEVRQRASASAGGAAESLVPRKRERLRRAAALWLAAHGASERRVRFDALLVEGDPLAPRLRLLRNAF